VLSLEPTARPTGGPLNHLGFRMPDTQSLVAVQERLERAGVRTNREEGVECCYARQTKFWVTDPEGTLWEVYTFEGDLDHRGEGQALEVMLPNGKPAVAEPVVWEHRLGQPVPERVPLADGSADEVRLRGSFNVPLAGSERQRLMSETLRVLKPGGRVFVHTLVAERPLPAEPGLSGPAAAVRHTPAEDEPVRLLADFGMGRVRLLKFDAKPCFVRHGVGMREQQLEGYKPAAANGAPEVEVVYKGPFAKVEGEDGRVYPRGIRVRIPAAVASGLCAGDGASQFTVFEATPRIEAATACGR
jgi:SAM-dependent methyltransferase